MAGLDLSSLKPVQPNQAEATPPAGALDVSTLRPYGTSAPPKGPVEPATSPIEDLGFAASRVGTAIPHLLEFAADTPQHLGALAQWGVSGEKTGVTADQPKTAATFDQFAKQTLGEPDFERYPSNGYDPKKLGDLYKDFLAAPQNAELAERSRAAKVPQAYRAPMIGTDILGKQLGAAAEGVKQLTGVDLNAAFPEAKNAKQQVIEGLTEGAVTGGTSIPRSIVRGALPALARQAGEKFTAAEASALRREIAADLLTGGVGGATGTMAAQNAPEGWELPAGIAGGLAGGVGAVGAMHGLDTAARKGAEYLRPAFPTKGNVERLAADAARASASNPEKAAVDIASATAPEGVEFTAGQASQDIGLLNLEQTLARGKDQKFKEAMVDRAREQNAAMVENLRRIEEGASPTSMSQFFADRMAQLQARNDQLHDSARKLAQAKADTLEAPDAADVGGGLQDALASEQTRIKDEISALDKAIDPDGSMVLPTRDVRARADEIYANMSPEERLSITPEERAMLDIIKGYGDVLPYQRFRDLRTQLNEDMRNASGAGKNRAYGRLAQLRAALEEDIKAAVENRFSRESNTAQEFVDAARNWYTRSVEGEAGAGAAPRPVAAAAGAPRGVPEAPGAAGDQVGVSAAPARDTGLPQDVPAVAPPTPAPPTAPTSTGVGIEGLDPADVGVDARRFQFKGGGDEAGVTERLQGIERWDPRLAGTALVFRDTAGKDWVADGHQRFGLARRLMDEGHPPIKVNSFVLDAADGYTDAQARAIAAVKNIAEGTGTPVDAAKVLRAAKQSGIDLPPLPPRSSLVKDGRALADLSPEAFGAVVNEVIPHQQAAIIGRLVTDPAQQMEAVRLLSTLKPDNLRQAELVIRDMLASGTEQMTRQGGLFGAEDYASSVTLERAKIADEALKLLRQDKRTFSTLVDEADRIENQGNVLSRASNEARLSTDERAADLLTQLAFRAGPVSTALSGLARRFKSGDLTASAAARDFLGSVRAAVESGVDTGADDGGAGVGPQAVAREVDPDATPRDPDTMEMFQRGAAQPTEAVVAAQKKYDASRKREDSIGPKSSLKQWMAAAEARSEARDQFANALDEIPGGLSLLTDSGLGAMVTRDSINGNWRVTYFDDRGFSGHSEYKTRPEAIRGALRDGYSKYAPDAIRQAMGGDAFTMYQRGEKFGGFDTEPGIEGLPQTLIPGVEPIDDAARIAAASSKPLKGGDAAPPRGGLFDDGEREFNARQMSLFQPGTIASTMADRFAAAGRPEPEAKAAGSLVDAFYTTMAKRLGKTVEQVQEQFPLPRVDKGGADPSDAPLFQPAYHGSPHIFDKFEWSDKTRGKGEGAQAFGDGLYFAGKKEVAQYYRDTLSKPENLRPDETAIADHKAEWDALVSELDAANAIPYARSTPESRAKWQDISNRMDVLHAKMLDETKSRNPKPGRLYKVDIPADDEMLSWDKSLRQQPKAVIDKLRSIPGVNELFAKLNAEDDQLLADLGETVKGGSDIPPMTGSEFYYKLGAMLTKQPDRITLDRGHSQDVAASAALREAGIPGHRFLDQGSRYSKDAADLVQRYGTREKALEIARQRADEASIPAHRRDWEKLVKELESEQTHNYVIYDDSKVNILDHEQPSGPDNPRGRIKFDPTGGASLISLFEKADASTALHEAGHQFLHMFRQFATAADAPANITKDWDAAKAWWQQNAKAVATDANGVGGKGVTAEDVRKVLRDQSTGDRMKDLAIDKGLHEQWARAFEVYLRDGKAPNAAMRGVFEQFRDWLTQVYKSITGMGVNLSPDIRSVFDRMLGGEGGGSNLIDADAAKRLKDVTGKWKNYYGTYTDKGAAPVPAIVAKTKGESYGFDLPPESVTKAAWKPGADGATAIRNLLNAAGNRRAEVMQGIEQSAMLSLARSTMKDGVVDPASFDKWKAKHSDALKAVPDLAKRMDSAANASREMNRIAKVNQDHLAAAQRSAAGAILKLGPDADEADIARKVGSMLSQQNGAKQMRELVRLTDGDPDALAGLRRAVVDHAISHFTRDDMMRAGAFSTWLGKNRGALSQALSAEQMQSLNALSAAADRIGRMIRAPGGGSPTVEYLSGLIERGESPSMLMSVLGNVAKNAVQSGLVGLGGHAVAGLGVGVGAAAGSFLSKLGIDALRARGFSKADDLLREAILDPQLMRRLLMKAPKRKGSGAAKELERALTGSITGLLAANRERDRNKQPRDMRPRAEQPKYTPMMGVRG